MSVLLSAAGSLAAAVMVARSIFYTLLPPELSTYLSSVLRSFFGHFSSTLTFVIDEIDGLQPNHLYDAASSYLSAITTTATDDSSSSLRRLKLSKNDVHDPALQVSVDRNQQVVDSFDGVPFKWTLICRHVEQPNASHGPRHVGSTLGGRSELRSFELLFHKKHKSKALEQYLPHVVSTAKRMKEENKTIKLYTTDEERMYNYSEMWSGVNLSHPATFNTLAMDPDAKKMVLDDLDRFLKRRDYYRRVGKAWKRGYLLYGPPGTGKSSLVAAMANYLKFDVYDLELGMLRSNSELRRLLVGTANRSILVVEDIDCSIKLKNRELDEEDDCAPPIPAGYHQQTKITLSGLLNFIDGLWSSCGDERIIIFTTNHKEKLDPALLRPGRMDMHIHMSYCSPSSFKVLASNYLGVYKSEGLFKEVEELIGEVNVTPAELAEQLMREEDEQVALKGLIHFLEKKKVELKAKDEAMADIYIKS